MFWDTEFHLGLIFSFPQSIDNSLKFIDFFSCINSIFCLVVSANCRYPAKSCSPYRNVHINLVPVLNWDCMTPSSTLAWDNKPKSSRVFSNLSKVLKPWIMFLLTFMIKFRKINICNLKFIYNFLGNLFLYHKCDALCIAVKQFHFLIHSNDLPCIYG